MIDHRLRHNTYAVAIETHSPAEVNLLVVSEETFIEAATFFEHLCSQHHARPCSPMNVRDVVILPLVGLNRVKKSSSTEWISESVDKSSCRPCIFESFLFFNTPQFRLTSSHLWVLVKEVNERFEPSLSHLYIAIQEHGVLTVYLL